MAAKKPLLVITDFDGTLSLTDVGYEVLLKFRKLSNRFIRWD
jgi:2-hydroxy-3-keto-5-methylthiopentenyl-1-phosphate phosphatase